MAAVELNAGEAQFLIKLIEGADPMKLYTPPDVQAIKEKLIKSLQVEVKPEG